MDELRDLAAAYAMDALDDAERAAFEAYMAGHPAVAAEVAGLRRAAAELASTASMPPPPAMRDAVLGALGHTPQEGTDQHVVEFSRTPRRGVWLLAAAAVIAIVVSVAGVLALTGATTVTDVLAAGDARTVALDGDSVDATFTFSRELGAGVFASILPAVAQDETYALWLIADGEPEPAGLFKPGAGGMAEVLVDGDLASGVAIGLTVEPAGGSPQPTGDILLLASLP